MRKIESRLRGPNLAVFVKRANGVPMEEALAKADEAGLVIASNKRLSKALVGSNEWRDICDVFGCWTGTMTAYEKPDQKLGKSIEYTDSDTGVRYVFPVPEEQQGRKNVILVAEHPDVCLVRDGNDRIVQAVDVGAVENFPVSNEGWFLSDQKYDIPQGNNVECGNPAARYLWRIDKRVGLVARDDYSPPRDYFGRLCVFLDNRASYGLGVAVEATNDTVSRPVPGTKQPKSGLPGEPVQSTAEASSKNPEMQDFERRMKALRDFIFFHW